jgi:hypothetical protein
LEYQTIETLAARATILRISYCVVEHNSTMNFVLAASPLPGIHGHVDRHVACGTRKQGSRRR